MTLEPLAPGAFRLTTRNPSPGNWIARNGGGGKTILTCQPLACAAASSVTIWTGKTPARNPDPQALERYAQEEVPKILTAASISRSAQAEGDEKLDILVSRVTSYKTYPGILAETKISRGSSVSFMTTAMIFAGPMLITVESVSPDRAVALKSLHIAIGGLTMEEGPPVASDAPIRAQRPSFVSPWLPAPSSPVESVAPMEDVK